MESVTAQSATVISISEYRPSFDEVFTELVKREEARLAGDKEAANEITLPRAVKSWTRFTAFIGKEVTEIVRRPEVSYSA